jgi:drug/metabolite transporter (DMT)-like permease
MIYYIALLLAVGGAVIYHTAQKLVPSTLNPFLGLIYIYVFSLIFALLGFFMQSEYRQVLVVPSSRVLKATFVIGLGAFLIELGFLLLYRAGGKLNVSALIVNVLVSCLLIPVGVLLFKEKINVVQVFGVALSLLGLFAVFKGK